LAVARLTGGQMNKRVVQRLLETFFRRWWLYLLPLVLFSAVGVMKGVNSGHGFTSTGVIDVSRGTLLSQLTSIRGENFGYETPANSTAGTMSSLLRTDQFMTEIAESAGVGEQLARGEMTPAALRMAIHVTPSTDTLLGVQATTDDPELSARLAKATIDRFVDYVVSGDVSESKAAEGFFARQLAEDETAVQKARADLQAYALAHPGGPTESRALDEQIEIQRLTGAVNSAESQYQTTQQKANEARLATEQAASDVSQRLRIVDEPDVPTKPEPRIQTAVMTVAIFVFVGMLLAFGAVVLGTVTDRSLRTGDDIEQLLGLSVIAVVPDAKLSRRGRHAKETGSPIRATGAKPSKAGAHTVAGRTTPAVAAKSSVERPPRSRTGRTEPGRDVVVRDGHDDGAGSERGATLGLARRTGRGGTSP
jgi:capsular polysaccharide biosynthesis protein